MVLLFCNNKCDKYKIINRFLDNGIWFLSTMAKKELWYWWSSIDSIDIGVLGIVVVAIDPELICGKKSSYFIYIYV